MPGAERQTGVDRAGLSLDLPSTGFCIHRNYRNSRNHRLAEGDP